MCRSVLRLQFTSAHMAVLEQTVQECSVVLAGSTLYSTSIHDTVTLYCMKKASFRHMPRHVRPPLLLPPLSPSPHCSAVSLRGPRVYPDAWCSCIVSSIRGLLYCTSSTAHGVRQMTVLYLHSMEEMCDLLMAAGPLLLPDVSSTLADAGLAPIGRAQLRCRGSFAACARAPHIARGLRGRAGRPILSAHRLPGRPQAQHGRGAVGVVRREGGQSSVCHSTVA